MTIIGVAGIVRSPLSVPGYWYAPKLAAMQQAGVAMEYLKTSRRSLRSITGLVQQVLGKGDWILILDHLRTPSLALGHLARELNYYNRTPIAFAGRSEHMEDIGTFRALCTDRSSRLELKPWSASFALEFAMQQAAVLDWRPAILRKP